MAGERHDGALDVTTLDGGACGGQRALSARSEAPVSLAATIVAHPDPLRVGERALIAPGAGPLALSRAEPLFAGHGGAGAPLGDPYLSRATIAELGWRAGGAFVRAERRGVVLDGVPLEGERALGRGELAEGAVLELGERVALLLHACDPRVHGAGERHGLVGDSDAIARLRRLIDAVAPHDVPVLLRGESGTGKELVAQAIHRASARRDRPFVSVNMAAIPATTAPAALFGHTRGAFSGAEVESPGYLGAADGGTLFLDEVAHAPEPLQVALLRTLENGEVQRLGESRPRRVDVRVVAATDGDLEADVDDGRFRLALLMRLAGYEVNVPPLRQRRDDIARLLVWLAHAELLRLGGDARAAGSWPPPAALLEAVRAPWPGNVRQLRNAARRLAIDHHAGIVYTPAEVPAPTAPPGGRRPQDLSDAEILAALERTAFRIELAAASLGVSRSALYAIVRKRRLPCRAVELDATAIGEALVAASDEVRGAARALGVSERALRLRMQALGLAAPTGPTSNGAR
jgi:two-component system, NtrC family, nitrogen regulation response regulator GlnG